MHPRYTEGPEREITEGLEEIELTGMVLAGDTGSLERDVIETEMDILDWPMLDEYEFGGRDAFDPFFDEAYDEYEREEQY